MTEPNNTMTEWSPNEHTYSLVGAHFRPPAKALLAVLPLGHALLLVPEPTNPYDPNAISVWIDSETLMPYHDELAVSLPGYGVDPDDLAPHYHLGYIPRTDAEVIVEELTRAVQSAAEEHPPTGPLPPSWPCRLAFDASGKYQVKFTL
jgi:hypothetical protein